MPKIHPKDARHRWLMHLDGCYRRGYADGLAGRDEQPYALGSGVQRQRRAAWSRGYHRAKAGKPLCDLNG